MKRSQSIFLSVLCLFLAFPLPAQTRDQVRQAEEQLRTLSPEQIEAKLKELGMSRWEAIRRAQEVGITLEDYVGRIAVQEEEALQPTFGDTTKSPLIPRIRKPLAIPAKKELLIIPGFSGRAGIDTTTRPFGYDLFDFPESAFEPSLYVAAPPSYVLGPGDELAVNVWGETKLNYLLVVNREGNLVVPEVGPISTNGLTIQQFRDKLVRRMTAVYSGLRNGSADANTYLDVSLGKLRSIQVFIVGEVRKPGGYIISSMATVFHALYKAGGPTVNGSLRHIGIVRSSGQVPEVDVYDYLVRGDRSKDLRLQDGDIVSIAPARRRVALVGSVTRPAIYEVGDKETLKDLLGMGGGSRFDTDLRRVHIERIIPFDQRAKYAKDVLDIDLNFATVKEFQSNTAPLIDGDIVSIFRITQLPENRVYITGSVKKPGPFQLQPRMRIKDLMMAADSLTRGTFMDRGLLVRMLPNLRRETVPFSPRLAMAEDPAGNFELQNEDSVVIFSERDFFPIGRVGITGAVRKPDYYPRHQRMTLSDLIVMAGGLQESAELTGWEISRLDTTALGVYAKVIKVNHPFEYNEENQDQGLVLRDFDYVFVPTNPKFQMQKFVDIQGFVLYPGPYPIRFEGERLADAIKRAGGLRPGAYLEGSRYFRRGVEGAKILIGQVPIDFKEALEEPTSRDNLVLYERDSVYISYLEDVIRVSGEVFVPSAILYKRGEGMSYYVDQAGGMTDDADDDRVYAFQPGGKKYDGGELLPGGQVFVPKKIEKEDKTLPIIRDLATILASLAAITVA